MPAPPRVNMAMIGDLAHHVVDKKAVGAPFVAPDRGKHLNHEGFFGLGRLAPMLAEDRHRAVARVTIQDGEFEGENKLAVALRVIAQLAQVALIHSRSTQYGCSGTESDAAARNHAARRVISADPRSAEPVSHTRQNKAQRRR
jgi:hypothetical protein